MFIRIGNQYINMKNVSRIFLSDPPTEIPEVKTEICIVPIHGSTYYIYSPHSIDVLANNLDEALEKTE